MMKWIYNNAVPETEALINLANIEAIKLEEDTVYAYRPDDNFYIICTGDKELAEYIFTCILDWLDNPCESAFSVANEINEFYED